MAGPDRKRVEELFYQVVDLPPGERGSALEAASQGDPRLRAAVERLLSIEDRGDPDPFGGGALAALAENPIPAEPGLPCRIGRYAIVRKIGEGGMGLVYEARQDHPHRTVALKVIRAPAWGEPERSRLNRFQHEAEILGQLQHPGIAQIYEAGIAEAEYDASSGHPCSAVPFFAMEFIHGRPLNEYAEAHRLGTRERLELVARICDAVHYAHQKGVIHRDLKPANILVAEGDQTGLRTEDSGLSKDRAAAPPHSVLSPQHSALPKILDFGVARTTNADIETVTLRTDVGQLVGTLPYMSPEQVSGDSRQIDHRADVYALGVILYELLAEKLPHDVRHRPVPEAVQIIREHEPSRLSSINADFRGDIDTIVAKALEKDKVRRYASAAELAADLRRYLRDEPIVARPASAWYQFRKLTRRHRGVFVSICVIFLLLVAGALTASLLFLRAERLRVVAVDSADAAQRQAYQAGIAAAQAGLANHDLPLARRALEGTAESLRGWEWRYLDWIAERGARVLFLPEGPAIGICMSRSAPRMAMGRGSGEIAVLDWTTEEVMSVIRTDDPEPASLALSPDGSLLAARLSTQRPPTRVWEVSTGHELWRRDGVKGFWSDAFSPDGSRLAMAFEDSTVRIVEARTGRDLSVHPLPRRTEGGCLVSPDGARILAAVDRYTITCLESDSRKVLWSRVLGSAGFCSDGRRAWWCDGESAGLLEAATGEELVRLDSIGSSIRFADLSPGGEILATRERSNAIILRDVRTKADVATLESAEPSSPQFTADGRWLMALGTRTVRTWDAGVSAAPFVVRVHAPVECFSREGDRALLNEWGALKCVDLERGAYLWNRVLTRKLIWAVAFSLDERRLLACEETGAVHLLDAQSGEVLAGPWSLAKSPMDLCWTAHGIAVLYPDGSLQLLDEDSGAVRQSVPPDGPAATCLTRSPDGRRLAWGSADGTVTVFDLAEGRVSRRLGPLRGEVASVAFSPVEGMLAAGSREGDLWVAKDEQVLHRLSADGRSVNALAFHPDGDRLASCVSEDILTVWDTRHGDRLLVLRGNGAVLRTVAFSADGRTLLAGSTAEILRFECGPPRCDYAERERFRRARAIIDETVIARPLKESVARLMDDASIPSELRDIALDQIRARGVNPNYLNSEAWGHVRFAGADAETYRRGLSFSEAACEFWPDDWAFLNTLGVARYRVGDYAGALETLERCTALRKAGSGGPHPSDVVFVAMAQWKLGREPQARASLAECKLLAQEEAYRSDAELRTFMAEAESMIAPPP